MFLGAAAGAGLGIVLVGCSDSVPSTLPPTGVSSPTPGPDGVLAVPEGFHYRVVAQSGVTRLDSGHPVPSDPDGAATFPARRGNGTVILCNHEIGGDEEFQVPHIEGFVYDESARGGTTTIEVDEDGNRTRHYVSLAGTLNNCAGGRTPWDTWLSCEETEETLGRAHGYVFEVDPYDQAANRDPQPIKALGRFRHEAVAVDPDEHVLYLTEDAANPNGLLYRYIPPDAARPLGKGSLRQLADDAGTLEALRALTTAGRPVTDLSGTTQIGTSYRVEWVEVPDRDATERSVRKQFDDGEISRGPKLEGMWWGDGGVYVVSSYARTDDGSAASHDGQVWFLDPREHTLTLQLRFGATEDKDAPQRPDNISVSPYGGVIVAEDHEGQVHLLGTTPEGQLYVVARTEIDGPAEFCGPVFSPDKRTLFANLQGPGYTFAIQGPFQSLAQQHEPVG
jgi:secreted PhoX family phosphatase